MGSAFRRFAHAVMAVVVSVCMALTCIPASALATDDSSDVAKAAEQLPGASVGKLNGMTSGRSISFNNEMFTTVHGLVVDGNQYRIGSITRGPFAEDDLTDSNSATVRVTVLNGKGAPGDYEYRWVRYAVGEDGVEGAIDEGFAPAEGAASVGGETGSVTFAYDLSKDLAAGKLDGGRYNYYLQVTDGEGNELDTRVEGLPVDVRPAESRYVDGIVTDTGTLPVGSWEWQFDGRHLGWATLRSSSLGVADGAYDLFVQNALDVGMAVRDAWQLDLVQDYENDADLFLGGAYLTFDATEWIGEFSVGSDEDAARKAADAAAREVRLLRTTDGESAQAIAYAGEDADPSETAFDIRTEVVDGKVHALLTFVVKAASPRETGHLGRIALAGPLDDDERIVTLVGSVESDGSDAPQGCMMSNAGEHQRSTMQSITYKIEAVGDGWEFRRFVIDGNEVTAGAADADGNTAFVSVTVGGKAMAMPVGALGRDFLRLDVRLLDAAYATADGGFPLVSGTRVRVVGLFGEKDAPKPPTPEVGKAPVLEIPRDADGFAEVTYFAPVLDDDGNPVLDDKGQVRTTKKTVDTRDGSLSIGDIMPGTDVTLRFLPSGGTGQRVVGYLDEDGNPVRDVVFIDGAETLLSGGTSYTMKGYGAGAGGDEPVGKIVVTYGFIDLPDVPDDRHLLTVHVAPGSDGQRHGSVSFGQSAGAFVTQIEVSDGDKVEFTVSPDATPAPGYRFKRAVIAQDGVDYGDADGKDVSQFFVAGGDGRSGTLTVPDLEVASEGGNRLVATFWFEKAPATVTVPDGLGAGVGGEALGAVDPVGTHELFEGDVLSITMRPAAGCELNPDATVALSGPVGKMSFGVGQFEVAYDDEGNPVYTLSLKYADVVAKLGSQATLGVSGGSLFREVTTQPDPERYGLTVKKSFETASGVTATGSVSIEGSAFFEAGQTAHLLLMPGAGSKVARIVVRDIAESGLPRVRTFSSFAIEPLTDWTLANIISDTEVEVVFSPVDASGGEEQPGLDESLVDVVTIGDAVGQGSILSPAIGSVIKVPVGGSQTILLRPADGWKVGRIVLGGMVSGNDVVGGTTLVEGDVREWDYEAVGGCKGTLNVVFVRDETADSGDADDMFEVDVAGNMVDAKVEILDVSLDMSSASEGAFDDYLSVDMSHQSVRCGDSVSFTLALKNKRWSHGNTWGYYGLYAVTTTPDAQVDVVPLTAHAEKGILAALTAQPDEHGQLHATYDLARTASAMSRAALMDAQAGAYLVNIPNVQSDLKVSVQLVELSADEDDASYSPDAQTPPSERDLPASFALTAESDGGGWVRPLYVGSNGMPSGAGRPSMMVYDTAGDDAARYVEFVPFRGYYLKSAYVQRGTYTSAGAWVADSGEAGRAVNVFSRVAAGRLDVRSVFDALGIGASEHSVQVLLSAEFAKATDASEQVTVTWMDGLAANDEGALTGDKLAYTVDGATPPATSRIGIGTTSAFLFDAPGVSAAAPYGWALDYVLVNGETKRPLPGKGYVTLRMSTDLAVQPVFRPLEQGEEKPAPPLTHTMNLGGKVEGGTVSAKGQTGSVPVVAGQSQTVDFIPAGPTKDYEWMLDAVTLDGVQLMSWRDGQSLPDGFSFDPTTGVGVTAAGERFVLDYERGTLTIEEMMASHEIGASFARAVEVHVTHDGAGLATPRGTFKWRVDVERASDGSVRVDGDGRELLVPDDLTVYVAPFKDNELVRFEVNGVDASDGLVEPDSSEGAIGKLRDEYAAMPEVEAAATDEGSGLLSAFGIGAASAEGPSFGEVRAYRLSADDLTRDGTRVTTVEAAFREPSDEPNAETFTIQATVMGGHGKVNGADSVTLERQAGQSATLRLSPDSGYVVKQVRDNKAVKTDFTNGDYTISDIQENHEVEVYFGLPGIPGANDSVSRTIRTVVAMAKTGDLALPLMFLSLGVALAAAGVAVIVSVRRRKS